MKNQWRKHLSDSELIVVWIDLENQKKTKRKPKENQKKTKRKKKKEKKERKKKERKKKERKKDKKKWWNDIVLIA